MEFNKENLYSEYIVQGKTIKECQEIFNCSYYKIKEALSKYNIKKKGSYDYLNERVKRTFGEGYSLIKIAKNDPDKILICHTVCGKSFWINKNKISDRVGCLNCFRESKKEITNEEFTKYYLMGYTSTEMKERFNINKSKFHHWAKKLGLTVPPDIKKQMHKKINMKGAEKHKKFHFDSNEVMALLEKGYSEKEISYLYGCTKSTVNKFVVENDMGLYKNINIRDQRASLKREETCLDKYGVSNPFQIEEVIRKILGSRNFISKPELELKDYVQSIYDGEVTRANDGKYELDIYMPDKRVGIEYNGNYWHSLKNKSKTYHYDKSRHYEEKGIRVIHIWEYEWNNPRQRPILENIIKNALGINEYKIYARKCTIEVRESAKMRDFFDKNNIQGFRGGRFAICLVYENKVVMAYMFGHCYFGKGKYDWEVIRGATELGYTVVGGASKIWKYFLDTYKPRNCVYYIDYNYFNGNSLPNLGLTYITSQPSFKNWWVQENIVKNREPNRHKEIKQLYEEGKVIPIYNAGTKVYAWESEEYKSED